MSDKEIEMVTPADTSEEGNPEYQQGRASNSKCTKVETAYHLCKNIYRSTYLSLLMSNADTKYCSMSIGIVPM